MGIIGTFPRNTTAVLGVPIGKLNDHERRISKLESNPSGGFSGTQEKSSTTPDGLTTTFAFAHTPNLIYWNGQLLTTTDDYTVSGSSITFTSSAGVPLVGDKILNVY